MTASEENKQFVLDAYRAFATRDKDKIAPYFAEDAEWTAPERNPMAIAFGKPAAGWKGRDAVLGYLTEEVGLIFKGTKVELLNVIADGDHVVVEQSYEGTVCNGRSFNMIYCFIFVVRDRLIRQVRPFFDTASAFHQIFGDEPPRRLV